MTPRPAAAARTLLTFILAAAGATPALAQAGEAKIDAQWFFATDAVHPGDIVHAALQITLEDNFHVQSNKPLDEFLVPTVLTVKPPQGATVREIVYPKPVTFTVAGFDEPLAVFDHSFVIGVALQVANDLQPGVFPVTAELQYQACNDKTCLAPTTLELKTEIKIVAPDAPISPSGNKIFQGITFSESPSPLIDTAPAPKVATTSAAVIDCDVVAALKEFDVLGTTGGYLGAEDFIKFVDEAEAGTIKQNWLEGKGPFLIVLLVLAGGIALNLTPCVLPLIPINLAIIGAGASAGSRARGFALGGIYGLAMALVYGALGLIVILTTSTFGAINSTIWFNVGIAILFVFLALAMFDVIAIDFTKYQSKFDASTWAKRGPFALAFGMGAVSALLAGACVAPIVIYVVVYAGDQYNKGSMIALGLPFILGLGMGLPWPFAGAGLSLLPKPGKWMVRVKHIMGTVILIFAGWYAREAWKIWDGKRVDPIAVQGAVQAQLKEGWTSSICDGLAQAKAENKPLLIDMWATWCKNCLAMDETTFKNELVINRLDGYVRIKFQAQDLSASPAREMIERFEQIGLPTYAILRPRHTSDEPAKTPIPTGN